MIEVAPLDPFASGKQNAIQKNQITQAQIEEIPGLHRTPKLDPVHLQLIKRKGFHTDTTRSLPGGNKGRTTVDRNGNLPIRLD